MEKLVLHKKYKYTKLNGRPVIYLSESKEKLQAMVKKHGYKKLIFINDNYIYERRLTISFNNKYSELLYIFPVFTSMSNFNYKKITTLDIDNYKCKYIDKLPKNLLRLNVLYTSIKYIKKLPKTLEFLNLSGSYIKYIPKLPVGIKSLYISKIKIKYCPKLPKSVSKIRIVGFNTFLMPKINKKIKVVNCLDAFPEIHVYDPIPIKSRIIFIFKNINKINYNFLYCHCRHNNIRYKFL